MPATATSMPADATATKMAHHPPMGQKGQSDSPESQRAQAGLWPGQDRCEEPEI